MQWHVFECSQEYFVFHKEILCVRKECFASLKEYLNIFSAAGENRGTSLKTRIGSMQGTSAGRTHLDQSINISIYQTINE